MEIPLKMTAAVTMRHGGSDAVEVRDDWPVPRPGPDEVLVAVTAAAVNNTDVWTREGAYGTGGNPNARVGWRGVPLDFPRIQGADAAGRVVAAGSAVSEDVVGRPVIVDPSLEYHQDRPAHILGSESDGAFAQFVVVPVDRIHDMTGSPLTDEQLACIPIAYATALGMIERAGCRPGERVLVTGASGGVGLAAVQVLTARGCEVAAITSSGKEDLVGEAGAESVFLRDSGPPPDGEFEVVVDLVGGTGFGDRLDLLSDGGRIVTAGAIAGPEVTIDLRRLYLRHRTILGSTMHTPAVFATVASMAKRGTVTPRVAEVFPLHRIHDAQAAFAAKDFVGKLVVVP